MVFSVPVIPVMELAILLRAFVMAGQDIHEIDLRAGGGQLVQGIESVRAAVAADYFDLHNDRSFIVHY